MKLSVIVSVALLSFAPSLRAAAPIANPDAYSGDEDTLLTVPAATGVLSNDSLNGNSLPLQAIAVTNAEHGDLILDWDGGFKYQPDTNYFGPDAFSYFARKALFFNVNSNSSFGTLITTITILDANGDVEDLIEPNPQAQTATSKLAGFVVGNLEPRTNIGPFTSMQLADFDITATNANTMHFEYSIFGGLGGSADILITVPTNGIHLDVYEPAPPGPITATKFNQTNILTATDLRGRATYQIDSDIAGIHEEGDTALRIQDLLVPLNMSNCVITSDGTTMNLTLPLDLRATNQVIYTSPDTTVVVDLVLTGRIYATANAADNMGEPSGQALVSLTVNPVDDLPVALPDGYISLQATPLVFGATAPTNTDLLISTGAVWSYLYTSNTALIGNWKSWAYNDSSWKTGAATLGFGAGNIVTDIRNGGPSNIVTAYFRRDFYVDGLSDSLADVWLSLKRDDAAAIYINGTEVYRDPNLPTNATHTTYPGPPSITGAAEEMFTNAPVNLATLYDGWNLIAVEVHNRISVDMRFDFALSRGTGAAGVLNNDYDIDTPASNLVSTVLIPPQHGTLDLNPDGSFTYTPYSGFTGTDTFAYLALDRPEPADVPQTLIRTNDVWYMLVDGTDPGGSWYAASFPAETNWDIGLTEIGFGDEPDGRPETTDIRPQPNPTYPVRPAYFFRKSFFSDLEPLFVTNITGRVLRDDAAAVYFNGTEVYRDTNLASNADYQDTATSQTPSETEFAEFDIPTSLLVQGSNSVAIAVHEFSTVTTEDLSFDFELIADVYAGAHVTVNVLSDDVDNDLVSDTYERRYGYDFSNPADALVDDDRDGGTTRIEFVTDTHPRDASSYLHASSVGTQGTNMVLAFAGISPDRTYQLQCSTNLMDWLDVGDPIDGSSLGGDPLYIPLAPGEPRRFYRLEVRLVFP